METKSRHEYYIEYMGTRYLNAPPGLLRLKVMTVRVSAVEVAILGSEVTSLDLSSLNFFCTLHKLTPRRYAQKSLTNSKKPLEL